FFFQAEDGIRDFHVTGVQTCALPIWLFRPVSKMLVSSSSYIEEKIGSKHETISNERFEQAIEQTVGHIATPEEVNIFKGILRFGNISVKQIMRTRLDIMGIPLQTPFQEVIAIAKKVGYSRIPVRSEE